jgi:hypothetical protein
LFRNRLLGFAEVLNASDPWAAHPNSWQGHDLGQPEWAMEFAFGKCPAACGGQVSLSSSTPWFGVIVDWTLDCGELNPFDCAVIREQGGRPVRLRGASLDELTHSWVDRFGPTEQAPREVGGLDAIVLRSSDAIGALIVRGGRTFAITVVADDGSSVADQLARLHRFLDGMRFPDPAAPLYRDDDLGVAVSSLDSGAWTLVRPGWSTGPGDDSVAFWFGTCIDNICNEPAISLSDGDPAVGAMVGWTGGTAFVRVRGATLQELRDSWRDAYETANFEDTTIDGRPAVLASDGRAHMAVLFLHQGRVVAISITPAPFVPFDAAFLRERLLAFSAGAVYLFTS